MLLFGTLNQTFFAIPTVITNSALRQATVNKNKIKVTKNTKLTLDNQKIVSHLNQVKDFRGKRDAFIIPYILDTHTNEVHYFVAVSTWKQSEHPNTDNEFDDQVDDSIAASCKFGKPYIMVSSEFAKFYDVTLNPINNKITVTPTDALDATRTDKVPFQSNAYNQYCLCADPDKSNDLVKQLDKGIQIFYNKYANWYLHQTQKK